MKIFKSCLILTFLFFFIVMGSSLGVLHAFELITAKEAYDMVAAGQGVILDVRTLEEYVFVGNPALIPGGDPIAYLIPWESLEGVNEEGEEIYKVNADFDDLIEMTLGNDKSRALIVICRSGNRSTYAAQRLEQIGFTNVYEVDNKLTELSSESGGRGGFQGSGYKNKYNGYRGYPGRLNANNGYTVVLRTDDIVSADDSVAWMDSDLPMTQKVNPDLIPKLNRSSAQTTANKSQSTVNNASYQYNNYQFLQRMPQNTQFSFMPTFGTTFNGFGNTFSTNGILSGFSSFSPQNGQISFLSNVNFQPGNFFLQPQLLSPHAPSSSCQQQQTSGSS